MVDFRGYHTKKNLTVLKSKLISAFEALSLPDFVVQKMDANSIV